MFGVGVQDRRNGGLLTEWFIHFHLQHALPVPRHRFALRLPSFCCSSTARCRWRHCCAWFDSRLWKRTWRLKTTRNSFYNQRLQFIKCSNFFLNWGLDRNLPVVALPSLVTSCWLMQPRPVVVVVVVCASAK